MNIWQVQEAKAKLSELTNNAVLGSPGIITVRGVEIVVVFKIDDVRDLIREKESNMNFITFMNNSPLKSINLKIERIKDTVREIDLGDIGSIQMGFVKQSNQNKMIMLLDGLMIFVIHIFYLLFIFAYILKSIVEL